MYERLKLPIIIATVIAGVAVTAYQQKLIPLWGAYFGMSLAIAAGSVIFLLRRD